MALFELLCDINLEIFMVFHGFCQSKIPFYHEKVIKKPVSAFLKYTKTRPPIFLRLLFYYIIEERAIHGRKNVLQIYVKIGLCFPVLYI